MEAHPKKGLSRTFTIQENGVVLATMKPSNVRESAILDTGDATYKFDRQGFMSGEFRVREGKEVIASAVKPSAFLSKFVLHYAGEEFLLKRPSSIKRAYELFQGQRVLGEIRPKGPFTRKTDLELPTAWPLPVKAFVFWLVYIIWTRDTGSASV